MEERKIRKTESGCVTNLIDLFTEQMNAKIASANIHTAANYSSCINKLQTYLGELSPSFLLSDVTSTWVKDWVVWLTKTHPNHPETVDFYFRNTRAMYNLVVSLIKKKRKMYIDTEPFQGIKIKIPQPSKRALSKNEIKKLLSPTFKNTLKPILCESLDILQFIFFANGIVFQDIYNLRWDMVDEQGRIRFQRSKTGSYIETSIVPEARQIMERYRLPNSAFIFPFLHYGTRNVRKVISEQNALRRINQHASIIGKLAGLSLPLTTYVIRHTWATLMLESGKTVELISQCMGHSNIRTTQIYLSHISSAKVEVEVNDMLNLVRQTPSFSISKRKKRSKPLTLYNGETSGMHIIMNDEKMKSELNNLLLDRLHTLDEHLKKDFLFLIKKRKILMISL